MQRKDFYTLVVFIALYLGVGGMIGALTAPDKDIWYDSLQKSTLTPPSFVFGIVWPALYVMIGIAAGRIWRQRGNPGAKPIITLFALQTILNWGWSFVFFTFHQEFLAFVWLIALLVVVAVLILKLSRFDRVAALWMTPYAAWLCFASYLSSMVWVLNR